MEENSALQKERQKRQILNGSLFRVMVEVSWPAVIAMVLFGLNSVLDAVFVGRYVGDMALAGVTVAYPLSQMSVALGSLVGVGGGSVLSIALGSGDKDTQERLMGSVNLLSLILTVLYMVPTLLFSRQLLVLMGGQGEALAYADEYFRITILGAAFWVYGLAGNMIVRAEGKMKSAAVMMALGLAVNAAANYILMVVFGLGVAGAAWGTNLGMLVYSLVGWIYFGKGFASFRTRVLSLRWDRRIGGSIVRLGLSSLIMNIMNLLQAVLVFNALGTYGSMADLAFYGAIYRVFTFLLTPIFGLMRALQPVIGINYGAGQYERVIRSYWLFTLASMALTVPFWLVAMVFPHAVLGLMLPELVLTGAQLVQFRVFMAILPLLSIIFMSMTFFPAVGKGKPAALIGIARQLVFYVPVMLLVPRFFGVPGIYYGSFAIDAVIVLWTVFMVKGEFAALRRRQAQPA